MHGPGNSDLTQDGNHDVVRLSHASLCTVLSSVRAQSS